MNSLLIIIFITYSSCLMEDYYKIYTLTKYSTTQYSSEDPSITVLDTTGIEGDMIYISFTFKENLDNNFYLYYNFTNNYPSNYFNFSQKLEIIDTFKYSTKKKNSSTRTYTTQFIFNIPKENKKYLVMQNLRYYSSTATIENHRINPVKTYTIQHILFISFCVIFSITVLSVIF